jgi:hypothetical protein
MDGEVAKMEEICILNNASGATSFWLTAALSWIHDHPNIDGLKKFAALRQRCVNAQHYALI